MQEANFEDLVGRQAEPQVQAELFERGRIAHGHLVLGSSTWLMSVYTTQGIRNSTTPTSAEALAPP